MPVLLNCIQFDDVHVVLKNVYSVLVQFSYCIDIG